jgi:hypothetical protein
VNRRGLLRANSIYIKLIITIRKSEALLLTPKALWSIQVH